MCSEIQRDITLKQSPDLIQQTLLETDGTKNLQTSELLSGSGLSLEFRREQEAHEEVGRPTFQVKISLLPSK